MDEKGILKKHKRVFTLTGRKFENPNIKIKTFW